MKLSQADAELLQMSDLALAAKCLRNGGAPKLAQVCEEAEATIRAREDLLRQAYAGLIVLRTMMKKADLTLGVSCTDGLLADMEAAMPELPGLSALRTRPAP